MSWHGVKKFPAWIQNAPPSLRETLIHRRVQGQLFWLRSAWDLQFSEIRLRDDLSLKYSDTTHAMERLNKGELFNLMDPRLYQFVQERNRHPGCPKVFIPLESVKLDLLNVELNWNDEEFEFQQNLSNLYVNTGDKKSTSNEKEGYPANLVVDAFISHGENLDIFSHLNMSLASDHIAPDARNVKKNFIWSFSTPVGILQGNDYKSKVLPPNLLDIWVLPKSFSFEKSEGKIKWTVKEMNEVGTDS